jgi:hypothetical protein
LESGEGLIQINPLTVSDGLSVDAGFATPNVPDMSSLLGGTRAVPSFLHRAIDEPAQGGAVATPIAQGTNIHLSCKGEVTAVFNAHVISRATVDLDQWSNRSGTHDLSPLLQESGEEYVQGHRARTEAHRSVLFRTGRTGAVALKIFIAGFIACTIPPFIVWAIGFHIFKINPAVLMGGVAGARSHSGPCREAAVEIQSAVPWIGFPVGYSVSGILLTVFGYFAMILAQ